MPRGRFAARCGPCSVSPGNVQVRELLVGGTLGITLDSAHAAPSPPPLPPSNAQVLTSAAAIRALRQLPPEGIHVQLRGLITFYHPHWHTLFFQDRTAGIFLHCPGICPVRSGQQVEVAGAVSMGGVPRSEWRAGIQPIPGLSPHTRAARQRAPSHEATPACRRFRAARTIRRREADGPNIPIAPMTACAMKGDREQCLEAGMDGYFTKPIRMKEIVGWLEAIAARVPTLQTLPSGPPASPVRDR